MRHLAFLRLTALCAIIFLAAIGCRAVSKDEKTGQTPDSSQAQLKEAPPEWPFTEGSAKSEISVSEKLTVKNYLLVYDSSGSMAETNCAEGSRKYLVARTALKEWISSVPSESNIGFISFHSKGWTTLPIGTERAKLISAVEQIGPGGNTPLGEAFGRAYAMLTEQALKQLGYGQYTIVTITDGQATDMDVLVREVAKILGKAPITIYTIGFCIGDGNHALNQPRKTIYRSANKPDELRQGLKEVLAESEMFDISSFN